MFTSRVAVSLLALSLSTFTARSFAQDVPTAGPATARAGGEKKGFPGVEVDLAERQVRVDCQTLNIEAPLEFFCVVSGTNEHESVLRSPIKPSHLHAALLMLGLEPGEPVKYSEAKQAWIAPHGPPLHLYLEFEKDGKLQRYPAYRLMRDVKTKRTMPPMTWIFAGSRPLEDGSYAADATGYLVSVVNFNYTVIDIPKLASNANESLEWEIDRSLMPPAGTSATLIFEPAGVGGGTDDDAGATLATTAPAGKAAMSGVTADVRQIDSLQQKWEAAVRPHDEALRVAAQAHYDVINAMRREQQRLIDEADRIQRKIDELEKAYQDMTTPRPAPLPAEPSTP